MELLDYPGETQRLLLENEDERWICFEAYLAHSPMHSTLRSWGDLLREEDTCKVMQGLAKISLGHYGDHYKNLTQEKAYDIITELSSDLNIFLRLVCDQN